MKTTKENYDYNKPFKVRGLEIITRNDYEGLPIPMCTASLTDDDMDNVAETIYHTMATNYGVNETNEFFNSNDKDSFNEKMNEEFWELMEECGLNYGMTYYEDM